MALPVPLQSGQARFTRSSTVGLAPLSASRSGRLMTVSTSAPFCAVRGGGGGGGGSRDVVEERLPRPWENSSWKMSWKFSKLASWLQPAAPPGKPPADVDVVPPGRRVLRPDAPADDALKSKAPSRDMESYL